MEVIDYIEVEGIDGLVELSVCRRHLPEGPSADWYWARAVDDPRHMEMRAFCWSHFDSDDEFTCPSSNAAASSTTLTASA